MVLRKRWYLSIGACYAYCFNKNLKIKPLNNLYLGYQESEKSIFKKHRQIR